MLFATGPRIFFTCGFGVLSVFFLLTFTGAAMEGYQYRDTRSRPEACDMGDSNMEIRETIFIRLQGTALRVFLFFVHF